MCRCVKRVCVVAVHVVFVTEVIRLHVVFKILRVDEAAIEECSNSAKVMVHVSLSLLPRST